MTMETTAQPIHATDTPCCPHCSQPYTSRTARIWPWERLLSRAYVFPWRCQVCDHRFLGMQWGATFEKRPIDRREYERLPVRVPAIMHHGQSVLTGHTIDISIGGCLIQTERTIASPKFIQVQLKLDGQQAPVIVKAAAIRSAKAGRLNIKFLRFEDPTHKQRLSEFMKSLHGSVQMARQEAS